MRSLRTKVRAAPSSKYFGRYAELIIERLNQVPNKNQLAFLDLIGASLLPPQPARVPLTFSLANGSIVDGLVPAGTQVATVNNESETAPVVFETDAELVVTAAQLDSLFVRRPEDYWGNNSTLINSISAKEVSLFHTDGKVEHSVYIAIDTLLSDPDLTTLTLVFEEKANVTPSPLLVTWDTWNGRQWVNLAAPNVSDGTAGLTKSGEVTLQNLKPFRRSDVNGINKCWLRCRLVTPIPPDPYGQAGKLPELQSLKIKAATSKSTGLKVDHAIVNDTKVDVVKGFFPFGERPKIGDTLYLAQPAAFNKNGATITLHISIANSPQAAGVNLVFEIWDGNSWYSLTKTGDTTTNLTKNGDITLTIPKQPVSTTINGIESFWIRCRITGGNYGKEAHFVLNDSNDPAKGYKLVPGTLAPPLIGSLTVDYSVTQPAITSPPTFVKPEVVFTYNDFEYQNVTDSPFKPFKVVKDINPTVYLGFTLPPGLENFPNRKISLYAALAEFKQGETRITISPDSKKPELIWEYSSGTTWSELTVRDHSDNLSKSGLIEFLAPPDFRERREFGLQRYWLRAIWKSGKYQFEPKWRGLLLNTTMATQAITIEDEVLGSSNQTANQVFHTIRAPVLAGSQLYIREPELPPANERAGAAVTTSTDRPKEIWVRWDQTPDFYGSGPRDRHYVLDNLTGEVRFGDGQNGLIPPAGSGNIRMSSYRTGGGAVGNKPAGVITQLKTTVPYVRKVVNHLPVTGGSEAETTDSLRKRAPRALRHGDRAVTLKDYEDLALLASTEVARAKCLPLTNLISDDTASKTKLIRNGTVSLIIIPRSTEAKSAPSIELIGRVQEFIARRQNPLADLIVTGPKYLGINVEIDVAPVSFDGAGEIKLVIARTISNYLHPLTGGMDGNGWDFGRYPHESNLYALIEALSGVDHVKSLKLTPAQGSSDVEKAGAYFLVYSGTHTINLKT